MVLRTLRDLNGGVSVEAETYDLAHRYKSRAYRIFCLTAYVNAYKIRGVGKQIQPMDVLRAFVAKRESQRQAAQDLGVSAPYLSDILAGKRGFSTRLLAALGLRRERTVLDTYRKAS